MPQPKTSLQLQLLDGRAYYEALLEAVPRAKQRIVLAAMEILSGPQTDRIFALIEEARARGVALTVLVDNYARFQHVLYPGITAARVRQTFVRLEALAAQGATVYYFGKVGLNPFKGRCHIKITVVDDDCFSFGGINFTDDSFETVDCMLHCQDAAVAEQLVKLVGHVGTAQPPLDDQKITLDVHNTLLFDGGRPKHSIIYERACELAAQATKVQYVSQHVPSSKLAHLLKATDAQLYFNRPEQMHMLSSWGQAFDQQKYRLTNLYQGDIYIHGKFILFELPGGKRVAITGSNNFTYRGVAFGTQEIALETTDPTVYEQLQAFLDEHVIAAADQ